MKKLLLLVFILGTGFVAWAVTQQAQKEAPPADPVVLEETVEAPKTDYAKIQGADQMLDSLVSNADKNHPDVPTSVGMQKEALNAMDQLMEQAQSKDQELLTAASAFFGAYHVNVIARKEFCDDHGVDISPFVRLFQEKNAAEYARTLSIFEANGFSADEVNEELHPQLKQATEIDMADIANGLEQDMAEACSFVNDRRVMMVREMSFKKRVPDVHAILMGAE